VKKKRRYKYEEVVEYAKKLLPKVKSRVELVKKVAEHFNLSMNTVDRYFSMKHFRTGFERAKGLKRMWEQIRKGERKPPLKGVLISSSLRALEKIYEKPRFGYELSELEKGAIIMVLRNYKLVKAFRCYKALGKKARVIYFLPHQKMQVYE